MNDLLPMIRELMNGNVKMIIPIYDYLHEHTSTTLRAYQFRQFYSAVGRLVDDCIHIEELVEANKNTRAVKIARGQIYREASNLSAYEPINMEEDIIDRREDNKSSRAWSKFKQRVREIFWMEWIQIGTAINLIESNIPEDIRTRGKQDSKFNEYPME